MVDYRYPLCNTYGLDVWQSVGPAGRICPPLAGFAEITYSIYMVPIPEFLSLEGVNYTHRAEFVTGEDRSIFCVEGWMMVGRTWRVRFGELYRGLRGMVWHS